MVWWVVSGSVHILFVSAMIVSLHLQYNVTVLAILIITLLLLEVLHFKLAADQFMEKF